MLKDIIVLDCGQLHPGPHAAYILGELGAKIIKIEKPVVGDSSRWLGESTYKKYNRGKLSISIDFKNETDKNIFKQLASKADVLIENFRPGVMDRLGLGYKDITTLNQRIIYCSISGYGQSGANSKDPGHDLNFLAKSGYWSIPSQIDSLISRPNIRLSDYCGSMYSVVSILTALVAAKATGKGSYIDVSIKNAVLAWTAHSLLSVKEAGDDITKLSFVMAENDLFETADNHYFVLGILENKFWKQFSQIVKSYNTCFLDKRYELREGRQENKIELSRKLKEFFKKMHLKQIKELFENTEVPFSVIESADEILRHEISKKDSIIHIDENNNLISKFPVKFNSSTREFLNSAPKLDGDRNQILDWIENRGEL